MSRFDDAAQPGQFLPSASPDERITVMLAAFEGWNDAGDAASDALKYLDKHWGAHKIGKIDAEGYYDFQFTRPVIKRAADGSRKVKWPTTRLSRVSLPNKAVDVVLVHGIEPSYRWRAYTEELLQHADAQGVHSLVLVGALLADVPHSRPIPVTSTSDDDRIRERLNLEAPQYEGPIGIVGALADAAARRDLPTLSLWAAVPHYVAQSPSPKAELTLLHKIEELLQAPFETAEIAEEAEAWERGVDELATDDPEVAAYVRQLEEAKDTADLPEATGESIAREFERYLRRRGKDKGQGQ